MGQQSALWVQGECAKAWSIPNCIPVPVCTPNPNSFVRVQPPNLAWLFSSASFDVPFRDPSDRRISSPQPQGLQHPPLAWGKGHSPSAPPAESCYSLPPPGPGEGLLAEPGSSNPTSLHIVALHRSALSCIAPHITPRFPSSSMVRGEGGTPLWGSIWGGEGTGAGGAVFIVTFDKDRIVN